MIKTLKKLLPTKSKMNTEKPIGTRENIWLVHSF